MPTCCAVPIPCLFRWHTVGLESSKLVLWAMGPGKHETQPMENTMPEKETLERAHEDKREGKAASTQAGEFVREEIHHIREGKHGARSTKQAIANGLSKARRAGVKLPPPNGKT